MKHWIKIILLVSSGLISGLIIGIAIGWNAITNWENNYLELLANNQAFVVANQGFAGAEQEHQSVLNQWVQAEKQWVAENNRLKSVLNQWVQAEKEWTAQNNFLKAELNRFNTAYRIISKKPFFTGQQLFEAVNNHRRSKRIVEVQLNDKFCNNLAQRYYDVTNPVNKGVAHPGLKEWWDKWLPDATGAENVGWGETPLEVIEGWVSSPGHRLTLENPQYIYGCAYAAEGWGILVAGYFP